MDIPPRQMGKEAEELMERALSALIAVEEQSRLGGIKTVTDAGKEAIGQVILLLWSMGA